MSSLLAAELSATCSALGYYEQATNKYHADENVLETLKDLIRYLRRDEDTRDVRRHLGDTNVLVTDLLPLFKSYWEQDEFFDVLLRLLVNLTTPALILWNEEVPTDRTVRNFYLQIEDHLQRYKEAFTDDSIWAILSTKLSRILELEYTDRGEDNGLVIERILILVRNVLYVPSDRDSENRPDNDANLHDQVLWALRQSGMLDIILYMSSSNTEQVYYMHIIELLSFMLREQSPQVLTSAALERNHLEKKEDETQLLTVRLQETQKKREKLKQFTGARHSRFGGTFVVKSLKAIGNNELIYHKPLNSLDKLDFDMHKSKQKTPKNRLPVKAVKPERHSAFTVRLFLKEFCIEFLNGAYNTFMYYIKRVLVRAGAATHDESYYLWALRFFMEFNRLYKNEVKLVSETMSKESFHYVQQRMEHDFDMLQNDKKKLLLWSKRLHLALLAYRELLLTLSAMDKSTDSMVVESARIIKCNIFYVIEYRELVLTLLITFDELKMSDVYLKDLMETQYIFLKMLEAFCKLTGGVVVAQKKRGKKKRKSNKPISKPPPVNPQDLWDEITSDLSTILSSSDGLPEVVPVDFTLPPEEQKPEAIKNIQRKLRNKEFEIAVALLRACRQLWPENDTFGKNPSLPEEEFLICQEIFFADLGEAFPGNEQYTSKEDDGEKEEEEEDDEEENFDNDYSETTLQFEDFAKRLCHPKVVRACALCLKKFTCNSTFTNHCTIKLLHRIAFDMKMYGLMFQASIFRTFQQIYLLKEIAQYKELVKFATYIMRQFFKIAEINPKIYMEVLFWKSCKEAVDIEQGYGTYQKTIKSGKVWTEAEENELATLTEEFYNKQIDENLVEWVTNNLVDNTKSKNMVMKKMRELGLLDNYLPKKSAQKRNQPWTEDEEKELKELYELFKNSDDPLGSIMANLSIDRPKNRIIEKLLVMGVIIDKSELRKKRKKKNKSTPTHDEDSDYENFIRTEQPPQSRKKPVKTKPKSKQSLSQVSLQEIKQIVLQLKQCNFGEALNWLAETLTEAADDLENAGSIEMDEGIPIVPLLDYCEAAFEDETFKKLLVCLGMLEATDEQVYWRIPCSMTSTTLRSYTDLIVNVDNMEEIIISENGVTEETTKNVDSFTKKQNRFVFNSSDDEAGGALSDNQSLNIELETNSKNINNVETIESHGDRFVGRNAIIDSSEDESLRNGENESKRFRPNSDSGDDDLSKPLKKKKKIVVLSSDDE